MKKEILTYFLVFCLFGMLGAGIVNYFGPEQKTATVGDSCTTEEKMVQQTDTSSNGKSCEDDKQGNIID